MREAGSTLAADMRSREVIFGGVGFGGGRGLLALARRLGFGWRNESTATQQGAAPDRPQCGRFCGCVALVIVGRDWRAAGELSVVLLARGFSISDNKKKEMMKMMKSKKLFLVVGTVLHATVTWAVLAGGSHSSLAYPVFGELVSPWLMGFYILAAPLVTPVLWFHFHSVLQITSTAVWFSLGLLNSFVWAWLAWNTSNIFARRRTI